MSAGPRCHAGAGHASDVADRGVWGWLCGDCWAWCERWIAKLTKTTKGAPT